MAIEKLKIPEAVLELPAIQHMPIQPIWQIFVVSGLDLQCCLVPPKRPPQFWFFSFAFGDDCSFEVKNIEIWVPTFFKHNNSSVATMRYNLIYKDFGLNSVVSTALQGVWSKLLSLNYGSTKGRQDNCHSLAHMSHHQPLLYHQRTCSKEPTLLLGTAPYQDAETSKGRIFSDKCAVFYPKL